MEAITIFCLILASGFFSASEIGIFSVSRHKVQQMASASGAARALASLLERPSLVLGVLLLSITAANYTAETIAASWAIAHLGQEWGPALAIAGMTVVVLIFAELTPISYAAANPERVALRASRPVILASLILLLPAKLLAGIADLILRALGVPRLQPAPMVTEAQIKTMAAMGAEGGVLEEEEKEIIEGIFEFGDRVAREVMVPRVDMVAVDAEGSVERAVDLAIRHRISRLPVYQGTVDNVVGVVNAKDLLAHLDQEGLDLCLTQVMRPAYFVPETKKVSQLLGEMRRRKQAMAIVVDEYGGTAGLVTIEDLLEEIVGDIYEEHEPQPVEVQVEEGSFLVDGKMSVREAREHLGVELPTGEYDTVGGLIYSLLGRVPSQGERLEHKGLAFVAERMLGRRILKVRIIPLPEGIEDGERPIS